MQKEGYQFWANEIPNFKEFWAFLSDTANSESRCSYRSGVCGAPFCGIRKCALQKKVVTCPFCESYPCNKILGLAKGYVNLLADAQRMKEIGIDAWVQEQEERRKTGFAYVDIRNYQYDVPRE
jgi:hypothetical protein